jgi:hypothetical protein
MGQMKQGSCFECGGEYNFALMDISHKRDCKFHPDNIKGSTVSKLIENSLPETGAVLSPAQSVQLMSLAVLMRDGEITFHAEDSDAATTALALIMDVGQEIALQVRKDEPEPELPENVVKLHKSFPAQQVIPTLRTIIDQIERGDYDTVTTACVCIGHTYEHEDPERPGIRAMKSNFFTFAAGPRVDMFTVRGLLLTCANTLGNAS